MPIDPLAVLFSDLLYLYSVSAILNKLNDDNHDDNDAVAVWICYICLPLYCSLFSEHNAF